MGCCTSTPPSLPSLPIPVADTTSENVIYRRNGKYLVACERSVLTVYDGNIIKQLSPLWYRNEPIQYIRQIFSDYLMASNMGCSKIWNMQTYEEVAFQQKPFVKAIELKDGQLACLSPTGKLFVWDFVANKLHKFEQGDDSIDDIDEWAPGFLATCLNGAIRVWNLRDRSFQDFKEHQRVFNLLKLKSGRLISFSNENRDLCIWHEAKGLIARARVEDCSGEKVLELQNGRILWWNDSVGVFDPETLENTVCEFSFTVRAALQLHDGRIAFLPYAQQPVCIWDSAKGTLTKLKMTTIREFTHIAENHGNLVAWNFKYGWGEIWLTKEPYSSIEYCNGHYFFYEMLNK